jgi:bifunctional DNA-binding transcriptional regulator/antitoxin component of YhaV-PrlF toxin-antitoxin module
MENFEEQARVNVGPQGRNVIPARLRRSLAIKQRDTLVARLEERRIVLEKREEVLSGTETLREGASRGESGG